MRASPRLLVALVLATAFLGLHPAKAAEDPLTNRQWALTQIHAASAWSVSTGKDVKIGIVDSGVNRNHEDLAGKVIASATCVNTGGNSGNCTSGGDDVDGHGTHVAGIAAAHSGNGAGIAGVAPGAKLIVARPFTASGNGTEPTADLTDVEAAIEWVVGQGAQIVNLSVGIDSSGVCLLCPSSGQNPLGPAVQQAWDRGALPIIASGNNNQQVFGGGPGYSNLDAIIVGATTRDDTLAAYSSAIGSAKWGIVAPGGDGVANDPRCTDASRTDCPMVLSSFAGDGCSPPSAPSCYAWQAGTSQAAPHVSGAAALLFARGLTRQEVVDTLLATADPIECGANCAGRLNVGRAVGAVANDGNNNSGGGGGGGGHTSTTRKSSSGTAAPKSTTTTPTPTTSPFTFNVERPSPPTTSRRPRQAIVLNTQQNADEGVPVGVGLAGIVSLAFAALAMSYNLRKTLTTLP